MMKKVNSILAVVLSSVLAASCLSGCGGGGNTESSAGTTTAVASDTVSDTASDNVTSASTDAAAPGSAAENEKQASAMRFDSLTEYVDNFEDETAGQRPSHWTEPAAFDRGMENHYAVYERNGNKVYGTEDISDQTMSYLHVFEKNPELDLDFYIGKQGEAAEFGVLFRMAPQETFLKLGYSLTEKKWYMIMAMADGSEPVIRYSGCAWEPEEDRKSHLKVRLYEKNIYAEVDGKQIFELGRNLVTCDGYGRLGIYTNCCQLFIDNVGLLLSSGVEPNDGVYEFAFGDPEVGSGATQIVDMGGGQMIATSNNGGHAYRSMDWGATWEEITEGEGWMLMSRQQRNYQNMLKLHDGTYLLVSDKTFEVHRSTDMIRWEQISQIPMEGRSMMPDGESYAHYMGHVASMVQFTLEDGTERILYPLGVFWGEDGAWGSYNMKTVIYYSDDNGLTWSPSPCDSTAFDYSYMDEHNLGTWGEAKLIQCPDGAIRMYSSRSYAPVLTYTESFDGGLTWQGFYQIPEIQTITSSISVTEDPYEKGTFYLVWVNDLQSISHRNGFRTRLSMARSKDGKTWEFVTDLERMVERYNTNERQTSMLFQVIDPNLTITEDYIYVTYARSVGLKDEYDGPVTGSAKAHGHVERWCERIEKSKLTAKEWKSAYIANMHLPKSLEVVEMPDLEFKKGDPFVLKGGKVRVTYLDGSVLMTDFSKVSVRNKPNIRDFDGFMIYKEPDMNQCGTQEVLLYNSSFLPICLTIHITE